MIEPLGAGSDYPSPSTYLLPGAVMIAVALVTRPLLPIDETRYLAVAWDMWRHGSWLLPTLNGVPYPDKPPLLFWLIMGGWHLTGVNTWWPRLVAPAFGLGCLYLTQRLGRKLFPGGELVGAAPLVLLGSLLWGVFTTLTMFDMPLTFFTLLGFLGMWTAGPGNNRRGWLLVAVAVGLGLLSKGPVIFVHLLPAALLAPWWTAPSTGSDRSTAPHSGLRLGGWYGGLLLAVLAGVAMALLWALPAARAGGPDYSRAILMGQTSSRLVHAVAHARPWWWFLPLVPLTLLPWSLWPPVWRGIGAMARRTSEPPVRFLLAWLVPSFILISAISGKQVHYLLPLLPGIALLMTAGMDGATRQSARGDSWLPAFYLLLLGAATTALPHLAGTSGVPVEAGAIAQWTGPAIMVLALALFGWRAAAPRRRLTAIAVAGILLPVTIHLGGGSAAAVGQDMGPIGRYLKTVEQQGRPIAHAGPYAGQFDVAGWLRLPLEVVPDDEACRWLNEHPNGRLIRYPDHDEPGAVFTHRYRDGQVSVWSKESAERSAQCAGRSAQ